MNQRLLVLAEWALMLAISACLFVGFFRINEMLFASLQHAQGINWIFLPAGFRVLLVLVMGLPGALGIVLGNLWLDQAHLLAGNPMPFVLAAMVSGLGPWGVRQWMISHGLLGSQLQYITAARLINFILIYAAVNAVFHQFIRWNFRFSDSQPWVDIWPMFVGDVIGAVAVLYAFRLCLPWLKTWARKRL